MALAIPRTPWWRSRRLRGLLFQAALVTAIVKAAKPGDHLLCMSNGGFGGIHDKLLKALGARS